MPHGFQMLSLEILYWADSVFAELAPIFQCVEVSGPWTSFAQTMLIMSLLYSGTEALSKPSTGEELLLVLLSLGNTINGESETA